MEEKQETATTASLAGAAEEGRLERKIKMIGQRTSIMIDTKSQFSSHPAMNYPVGKPLEVSGICHYYFFIYFFSLKIFYYFSKNFKYILQINVYFFFNFILQM